MIELVLGGARSGKSAYAEKTAINSGLALYYVATAAGLDEEMRQRISHHQAQRAGQSSVSWFTVEEPIRLAAVVQKYDNAGRVILVDCLTLWLSNNLLANDSDSWQREKADLLAVLPTLQAQVILVSNEVGQGIVPLGEINRRFVDEAGRLHQQIAAMAHKVTLVTAGLAQQLKNETAI